MKLFTRRLYRMLKQNHQLCENKQADLLELKPVVKLYTPDNAFIWLLVSLDNNDILYGLYDIGTGSPTVGEVPLDDLLKAKEKLGFQIEIDQRFKAITSLREYADLAIACGQIIA